MKIEKRASGVLLHITSLPSEFGIGDLGPCSYKFVDLLAKAKQHYWNVLPLTPTSTKYGNSPYQPTSAFAGNTLLISPELLMKDGFLSKEYVEMLKISFGRVNFKLVTKMKKGALREMHRNLLTSSLIDSEFDKFCSENSAWLEDYALFRSLEQRTRIPWYHWPKPLRDRNPRTLSAKRTSMKAHMELEKFAQFVFFRQWKSLKEYSQTKGVSIVGDLPFYVSYDSADVWVHPELFKLGAGKCPIFVAGVPPDYFSKNGQLWGNPVYDWKENENGRFQWWIDRIRRSLKLCDIIRLDHFRGFTAYWQVRAYSKTAKKGKWIKVPSERFFETLKLFFPSLPFVAEDLGSITSRVRENLKCLGIPGLKVLLFAFDGSQANPNLPANYAENSVVFTGTHDTNTVRGWFVEEAKRKEIERVFNCVGKRVSELQISQEFIKLSSASRSRLCIIPLQDALSLGSEARMNNPACQAHNWEWRVSYEQIVPSALLPLREITEEFERE